MSAAVEAILTQKAKKAKIEHTRNQLAKRIIEEIKQELIKMNEYWRKKMSSQEDVLFQCVQHLLNVNLWNYFNQKFDRSYNRDNRIVRNARESYKIAKRKAALEILEKWIKDNKGRSIGAIRHTGKMEHNTVLQAVLDHLKTEKPLKFGVWKMLEQSEVPKLTPTPLMMMSSILSTRNFKTPDSTPEFQNVKAPEVLTLSFSKMIPEFSPESKLNPSIVDRLVEILYFQPLKQYYCNIADENKENNEDEEEIDVVGYFDKE